MVFPIQVFPSGIPYWYSLLVRAEWQPQGKIILHIGPYLTPIPVNIQYPLLLTFLYGLVTPTTVYA